MSEILLPATDQGALTQAIVVVAVLVVALIAVRKNKDYRTFVTGLLVMSIAWFALRTVH